MRSRQSMKVLSEIRDLEIFDAEGELCGIADEVEFEGAPGGPLQVSAILVGPGAYEGRLPRWAAAIARRIAGRRMTRTAWSAVAHVTSHITLNRPAAELGLNAVERRLAPLVARLPFS